MLTAVGDGIVFININDASIVDEFSVESLDAYVCAALSALRSRAVADVIVRELRPRKRTGCRHNNERDGEKVRPAELCQFRSDQRIPSPQSHQGKSVDIDLQRQNQCTEKESSGED